MNKRFLKNPNSCLIIVLILKWKDKKKKKLFQWPNHCATEFISHAMGNRGTKRVWPSLHRYLKSFASELIYQIAQSILLCLSFQYGGPQVQYTKQKLGAQKQNVE